MAALTWDQTGERIYETGTKKCVLYRYNSDAEDKAKAYDKAYAWNGISAINETPEGGEASDIYADDIKYLTLYSTESLNLTLEAYTYPDEFGECDGSADIATGVKIGQQSRKMFGLSYVTTKGNDVDGNDYGYLIHCVYGCKASPSERSYATTNDSPEAITFSWEISTTPVDVEGYAATAIVTIDSTKVSAAGLAAIEKVLYGTEDADAYLPLPAELITLAQTAA